MPIFGRPPSTAYQLRKIVARHRTVIVFAAALVVALLGAVGGPKWSDPGARVRPEQGLLELRRTLGVFANLRPVRTMESMLDASPLKPEVIIGADIMVVRELTGGIYFGRKSRTAHEAEDVCTYTTDEVERVTRVAGRLAMGRRRRSGRNTRCGHAPQGLRKSA